jgi:hypothetical protein
MLVSVELVTTANVPLNLTTGVVPKLVPNMVTAAPTAPLFGLKLVIVGEGSTVKFVALVSVMPLTVSDIGPVVAPFGTVVVIEFVVELLTIAFAPLN